MPTRKDWTKGTGTPPVVKGLIWFTDGSKMEGTGAGVYGQSACRRLCFSWGRYPTVFQAEIYAILACVHEIQFQNRPEKYLSALRWLWKLSWPSEHLHWSDSAKRRWTISLPDMWWGCSGSLDMLGYEVMRLPMSSQGTAVLRFVGHELMKPLPTLFACVKLWLHSDMRIWVPSSWSQRTLRESISLGAIWNCGKATGLP